MLDRDNAVDSLLGGSAPDDHNHTSQSEAAVSRNQSWCHHIALCHSVLSQLCIRDVADSSWRL